MARTARLCVGLGPHGAAELDALCQRWRCGRAEAVRRALHETADREAALRPVMEALARIEAQRSGGTVETPADGSRLNAAWGDD